MVDIRDDYTKTVIQLKNIEKKDLVKTNLNKNQLTIVYVLRQVEVYGGTKIIFQHANKLVDLGVNVILVSRFKEPNWIECKAKYIVVPEGDDICDSIPECDIIVATSWYVITDCVMKSGVPVVFFEQGGSHLFEYESFELAKKEILQKVMKLPNYIYTVSNSAAQIFKEIYDRNIEVFHNALDKKIFYYNIDSTYVKDYILMIGNEKNTFKGIKNIIEAHKILINSGYNIRLKWITPEQPTDPYGEVIVNPSQKQIGDAYRNAKLFVSASEYESFSLPPLEAMSCGCPVVSTVNLGILEYGIDRQNCLLSNSAKPQELANSIIEILKDRELEQRLIRNGLKTAKEFDWDNIIPKLFEYYKEIGNYRTK